MHSVDRIATIHGIYQATLVQYAQRNLGIAQALLDHADTLPAGKPKNDAMQEIGRILAAVAGLERHIDGWKITDHNVRTTTRKHRQAA